MNLPTGVRLHPLVMHRDKRGVFSEVFRKSWETGVEPVQWNIAASEPGVLRGVHVHIKHTDYLVLLRGRATIGLCDLRCGSPTERVAVQVEMRGDNVAALTIPLGVAHGFFFHEPSIHIYAVSEYWDTADELGCHWADPALGIQWPVSSPVISERDAALPLLSEVVGLLPPWKAS